MPVPKIIFIVPYRDREAQKNMFVIMMNYILEDLDKNSYEIYFSHQQDTKPFNRGASKNMGFLYVKNKYPNDYKNMTFVFNDVDTLPGIKNLWDYETTQGIVKHYYGFTFALGGIVSINGGDFERINGYPCYWGWGFEDNCLLQRCIKQKLTINRDIFYEYKNKNILQFNYEISRDIDKKQVIKFKNDNGTNGLLSIKNINSYEEKYEGYYIINITNWTIPENHENIKLYKSSELKNNIKHVRHNMNSIMLNK